MANATVLHQLKASAQFMGPDAQKVVDRIARAITSGDEQADGLTVFRSNTLTTTATNVKASAGRLYAVIIEPAATAASGTGGSGVLQLYNAASGTNLVPGAGTASTLQMEAIKFVTGMIRCVTYDPAAIDSTELYSSGITAVVATTAFGATAVAALPKVTIVYA